MSTIPGSESQPQPDPERFAREEVLRTGDALIALVEERGAFQFDGKWMAKPMLANDDPQVRGAVYELDDLRYDRLDRAEISQHDTSSLNVRVTTVRPNVNTRTTRIVESRVTAEDSTHLVESRWSDVMPEGIGIATIHELRGQLTDLQKRVDLPPAPPRRSLWGRIFRRMSG